MKYYAVAKGRKTGIFTTWDACKEQIDGFSGAIFKSFATEGEAKRFISGNKFLSGDNIRLCVLCGKPKVRKGGLCVACTRRKHDLELSLNLKFGLSQTNLITAKAICKCDDIFDFLTKHPQKVWEIIYKPKGEKKVIKSDYKQKMKETPKYRKGDPIPEFVKTLLGSTKTAISVTGDKGNPNIIYLCHKCGETLYTRYSDYKAHQGHDCDGIKSSGEVIVEQFLKKNGISYKTQRDTLRCVNPETGFVMPYDFELTGKKVLIEVQGEQHRKFIPRFHVTKEAFDYQVKKDRYKKAFAIQKGYTLVEIWYEDLTEDRLCEKLKTPVASKIPREKR